MRVIGALTASLALLAAGQSATAANIVWTADSAPPGSATAPVGFAPVGSGYTDSAVVALLQNAGHNVIRYNNPEANTTLMSAAEVAALNTNDLVIIGRACASGQFQDGQGDQWNQQITAPLICMSPYLVRTLEGSANRMGWFTGVDVPDDLPTPVTAANSTDPAVDFLLAEVPMLGMTSVGPYDELIDRNTSHITDPVVAGGRVLLTATFPTEVGGALTTGKVIADFPAGTSVRSGLNVLAGYRMFFAGGSREGETAPNAIPLYTGRENLTPAGESLFLRAVTLALNNGVPPAADPSAPMVFTRQPAGATVKAGDSVTFTVVTTGGSPRVLQWQRFDGGSASWVNIADASTPFRSSGYTLPAASNADNGARFRVTASNGAGNVISDEATLTVNPDTTPPQIQSVSSFDGTTVDICFSEDVMDVGQVLEDPFSYTFNNGEGPFATTIAILNGRRIKLNVDHPLEEPFTLALESLQDAAGNVNPLSIANGIPLGLSALDVGSLNPPGSNFVCDGATFEISGGGLDLASTSDSLHFVYKATEGDFDARVRVQSLVGAGRLESVAKAVLTARETTDASSAAINVFATPPNPGDDSIVSSYRASAGAATNTLGVPFIPNEMPNTWMRITRAGNLFTTYHSSDGSTWSEFGTTSITLPARLLVGMGVISHRNGFSAVGTFSNFQVSGPTTDITLVSAAFADGNFSASFNTQNGVSYEIQYKNELDDDSWSTLTTIVGDGASQTFTDTEPSAAHRFYRVVSQ